MRYLLLLFLSACNVSDLWAPASPPLPRGAVAVQVTDDMRRLWKKVEACSGKSRNIDSMRFYVMPEVLVFEYRGSVVAGVYLPHYALVVGELASNEVLAHEMLHAIRWDVGSGHENDADFTTNCKEHVA